jgi:hypothetical protein
MKKNTKPKTYGVGIDLSWYDWNQYYTIDKSWLL